MGMIVKCVYCGCKHNLDGRCQAISIELVHSDNYDGEGLECLTYEE